jgi:hypothetical protein
MTDLKALAYELLAEAQASLQNDGHLNPTAVVITPAENLIFDLEFETDEDREELYAEMMDVARAQNASAILTVNDVFLDETRSQVQLEGERWGNLAGSPAEAVAVTASGSGFETWTLISAYFRKDGQFIFQHAREAADPGGEVPLLGDWTGKAGAA